MRNTLLASILCVLGLFQSASALDVSNPGGGSDATKVPLAGGTMTGNLVVSSAAIQINGDTPTPFLIGASSFIITSGGFVGVGTSAPGSTMTVVGNFTQSGGSFTVRGPFSINRSSFVVAQNGGVGIGLTNPSNPTTTMFDVATPPSSGVINLCMHTSDGACNGGVAEGEIDFIAATTGGGTQIFSKNNSGLVIISADKSAGAVKKINFQASQYALNTSGNNSSVLNFFEVTPNNPSETQVAFTVDLSSNVGIGNRHPGSKLHMSSGTLTIDGNTSGLVLSSGATTGSTYVLHKSTTQIWNPGVISALTVVKFSAVCLGAQFTQGGSPAGFCALEENTNGAVTGIIQDCKVTANDVCTLTATCINGAAGTCTATSQTYVIDFWTTGSF